MMERDFIAFADRDGSTVYINLSQISQAVFKPDGCMVWMAGSSFRIEDPGAAAYLLERLAARAATITGEPVHWRLNPENPAGSGEQG